MSRRLLLLGLAGLYLTWVLVIPPFGGIDEFDHAYRAAATARGQWDITPAEATRGTGAWLRVPRDIVEAAQPECAARSYTTASDCVGTRSGDTVRIASGAGRYHPLFYAVIGWPARAFNGTAALYAMRLMAMALSMVFLWGAVVAVGSWARTQWGPIGLVVACSPVVMYSGSVAAPNGVEMTAALALWGALVGLAVAPRDQLAKLTLVAAAAGVTLCTLRSLGPLWCLLAVLVVLVGVRPEPGRLQELLRRRSSWLAAALVTSSAIQSVAWTLAKGSMRIGGGGDQHLSLGHRMSISARLEPLWALQSIAAFPLRDNATHPAVYACYLIVFVTLLGYALILASPRLRLGLGLAILIQVGVPFAATVSSYNSYAAAWQGRYGLPLGVGIVVLAALALDRRGRRVRSSWWVLGGILFVIAQVVSATFTLGFEAHGSPLADRPGGWLQPAYLVAALLATASSALVWWSTSPRRAATHASPPLAASPVAAPIALERVT